MKIFITIPWFLPAFRAGGPIRSIANLANEFSEADIFIFCGDTDINGAELSGVETGKWIRHNSHTLVWYADEHTISHQLTMQAEKIKPDVIFMVGMYSWHFTAVPLLYCKAPKKIISVRGMLHPGALSQKRWKKKIFLKIFKLFEFHYKVGFHTTDEEEKQYVQKLFGENAKINIVGNIPTRIGHLPLPEKMPGKLKLVSVSLISPMKNILSVLNALKQVTATVEYTIHGAIKDDDYWQECRKVKRQLPANITVNYCGASDFGNVKNCLAESHVFILPSESENFGHALYEALSAGRPLITSDNTPWKNLEGKKAGLNINPNNEDEIVRAIGFFAGMDAVGLQEWSLSASSYASARFDKEKVLEEYREMFF